MRASMCGQHSSWLSWALTPAALLLLQGMGMHRRQRVLIFMPAWEFANADSFYGVPMLSIQPIPLPASEAQGVVDILALAHVASTGERLAPAGSLSHLMLDKDAVCHIPPVHNTAEAVMPLQCTTQDAVQLSRYPCAAQACLTRPTLFQTTTWWWLGPSRPPWRASTRWTTRRPCWQVRAHSCGARVVNECACTPAFDTPLGACNIPHGIMARH
jgi:hypothetical protein